MTHEETDAQGIDIVWPNSTGSNGCQSLDLNLDLPGSQAPA